MFTARGLAPHPDRSSGPPQHHGGRRSLTLPVSMAVLTLVVLLSLRPVSTSRTLAIWIVLATAITLATIVRRPHGGEERRAARFEAALLKRPAEAPPPVELLRMERELDLGIANAAHAQRRLLPLLRAAAAARLGSSHGIELDRSPATARALLGEETWELLRPDRPEPADRHGPGPSPRRIAAAIERLEAL
jgi:hypothetical protein